MEVSVRGLYRKGQTDYTLTSANLSFKFVLKTYMSVHVKIYICTFLQDVKVAIFYIYNIKISSFTLFWFDGLFWVLFVCFSLKGYSFSIPL